MSNPVAELGLCPIPAIPTLQSLRGDNCQHHLELEQPQTERKRR